MYLDRTDQSYSDDLGPRLGIGCHDNVADMRQAPVSLVGGPGPGVTMSALVRLVGITALPAGPRARVVWSVIGTRMRAMAGEGLASRRRASTEPCAR